VRFSVYVVWPSVLSLNNLKVLKINKRKQWETFIYKKNLYWLYNDFYSPGLALTGFWTTWPCLPQLNPTGARYPIGKKNGTWSAVNFKKHVASMSSKLEPAIWTRDTGRQIPCLDRWQSTITWISNIKKGRCKRRVHVSVNLLAGVWPPSYATPSPSCVLAHEQYR